MSENHSENYAPRGWPFDDLDAQRASAALALFMRDDRTGVNAVIAEAEADGSLPRLVWAVMGVPIGLQEAGWDPLAAADLMSTLAQVFAARRAQGEQA